MASLVGRVLLLAVLLSAPALAQSKREQVPIKRLPKKVQAEARTLQGRATVRARLTPRIVNTRVEVYRYLLNNLPQSSRWLRALNFKLGSYTIKDRPDGNFEIDDHAGAFAICERVLEENGRMVVIARGRIDVPVLPRLKGKGLVMVRYTPYAPPPKPGEPQPTTPVRCWAQVDFRAESRTLHALSRPFRRTLSRVITRKLDLLVASAIKLAEQIHRDPWRIYQQLKAKVAARKLDPKDLETFRRKFVQL